MLTLQDAIAKVIENPELKVEWDALEPEFQIIQGIIEGRQINDFTQKQLVEATGINQANISRLENGTANPSLNTLKRLASGMGINLKLEFVPIRPAGQ